jgi:hypothetical protein
MRRRTGTRLKVDPPQDGLRHGRYLDFEPQRIGKVEPSLSTSAVMLCPFPSATEIGLFLKPR